MNKACEATFNAFFYINANIFEELGFFDFTTSRRFCL